MCPVHSDAALDLREKYIQLIQLACVGFDASGLRSKCLHRLIQLSLATCCNVDKCALLHKAFRCGQSYARVSTRDECDFSFYFSCHVFLLSVLRTIALRPG